MREYSVATLDPTYPQVLQWIMAHNLKHSVHLESTQFFVPEGYINTKFQAEWAHTCPPVDHTVAQRAL